MNRSTRRRCGVSTALSARRRCTWPRSSPPTTRRACPPSGSTGATCQTSATPRYRGRRAEAAALRAGRARRRHDARQVVPVAGRRVDGHRRVDRRPRPLRGHLGMRVEAVDMTELVRRIEEEIFDREELARARRLGGGPLPGGPRLERGGLSATRAQKDADWETSIKMTIITRDLMVGNPRLAVAGFGERPSAQPRSSAASRASGTGVTTSRTATSWRRSSLVLRLERHPRALVFATEKTP